MHDADLIPEAYRGREQTYIKHLFLNAYVQKWSKVLGSLARRGPVKLWFVDCFSGPWRSADERHTDTSIFLGLKALVEASEAWGNLGATVELGAIFVEKNARAFVELQEVVKPWREKGIEIHTLAGEFGDHVPEIERLLRDDPAFLFIDPTGWKGIGMRFIQPLARHSVRDVMINLMHNYVNRFKDDERDVYRDQMTDLFGGEFPHGLDEDALIDLYRDRLAKTCDLEFVADVKVMHPTQDRTWFRLVVGGHNAKVIEVFRDVEAAVIDKLAPKIRAQAKGKGQLDMFGGNHSVDVNLTHQRRSESLEQLRQWLLTQIRQGRTAPVSNLWPRALMQFRVTHRDVNSTLTELWKAGEITVEGMAPRGRTVKDDHFCRPARKE